MNGWLLDTNVPSELVKAFPNPVVRSWFEAQQASSLYLSVITLGELQKGFNLDPQPARRIRLLSWYADELLAGFHGQILPVNETIAEQWGILEAEAKRSGIALATPDGLIAATALVHNLTVVTRNVRDFARTGVQLFNPWEL